jgi:hypothetical protein
MGFTTASKFTEGSAGAVAARAPSIWNEGSREGKNAPRSLEAAPDEECIEEAVAAPTIKPIETVKTRITLRTKPLFSHRDKNHREQLRKQK